MSLFMIFVQIILLVSTFVLNSAQRHEHSLTGSCPSVCQCKWKNGKEVVECVNRALITIPDNIEHGSQVLNISNNNLQILPKEAFKRVGLIHMQRIYLENCKIGQIDDHAFYKLTNLIELDLASNLLTSVPNGIFPDVNSLRELILANNPIQKIEAYTFINANMLRRLDLSNCEIESIAPKSFDGAEGLELLRINGNKLTELRPHTIDVFIRLHSFELYDNQWKCDCNVRVAKEYIVNQKLKHGIDPVCSSGSERVLHKKFIELHEDDFACKPEILPVSRYVETSTGENATLTCRASAIPLPEIKWFYQGRLLTHNSNFSPFQKVYIFTNATNSTNEKKSQLMLTNSQVVDSNEFYCVAENRAGSTEANFTLHVALRPAGFSSLNSGQIVGLSAALVVLILFIILLIMVLLVRLRRIPFIESKTPGQVEVMVVNSAVGCPKTTIVTTTDSNVESSFIEPKPPSNGKTDNANPVQKPPRLNDLPYTTSHYNGNGSIVNAVPCYISPSSTSGNNPDLINDTKRLGSGDIPTTAADSIAVALESFIKCDDDTKTTTSTNIERPNSGEYIRNGNDSLYPSGNWAGSSSSDLYIKRVGSAVIAYDDKAPIMGDGTSCDGSEADSTEFCSKSLPRMRQQPPQMGHVNPGYPPDYGLPIVEPRQPRKPPTKAKVQRIYQQGGVPVLPPVKALKRSRCRGSPDEGYQEGTHIPTDV